MRSSNRSAFGATEDDEAIAQRWLHNARIWPVTTATRTPPSDYDRELADIVSDLMVSDLDPARAWQLLVRLTEIAETETDIANVAIGPLQSFLLSHGDAYVEQIDDAARSSPSFRNALRRTMPHRP